jgi:hypothetical protein
MRCDNIPQHQITRNTRSEDRVIHYRRSTRRSRSGTRAFRYSESGQSTLRQHCLPILPMGEPFEEGDADMEADLLRELGSSSDDGSDEQLEDTQPGQVSQPPADEGDRDALGDEIDNEMNLDDDDDDEVNCGQPACAASQLGILDVCNCSLSHRSCEVGTCLRTLTSVRMGITHSLPAPAGARSRG